MPKIQMVCGVPCEILEERIEQGIFWENDKVRDKLADCYNMVVRPDTGDILMVWNEYRGINGATPLMGISREDDVLNAKIARSLTSLARRLAKETV